MGRDGVKYLVNGTGHESTISSRGGIMERVGNTGKCSPAWLISRSGTRGGDNGRNEETDTYLLLFICQLIKPTFAALFCVRKKTKQL